MYLDTAILLKLLVREQDSDHWVALVDRQIVWSSRVTIAESVSALLRKEREQVISAAHRRRAERQIERDAAEGRLNLVPLSVEVVSGACEILRSCHPAIALRSLDAIHLAAARECRSWPLATNDKRMRAAAKVLALPLCPLPAA